MNRSINARMQGDEYQALFFWGYALKMFYPHAGIEKVAYEADNVKSFDDIVVYYKKEKPTIDCRHNKIYIDFFQVKFHVVNDNTLTWDGLIDPKIINAKSVSIMERLRNAQETFDGSGVRFFLVSQWQIHSEDSLSKIVSNRENEIRIDKLFAGGNRSMMGKMRLKMNDHLGFSTDAELESLLIPFRIWHSHYSSQKMINMLNQDLVYLGFKPIENNSILNPYTNLIRKWSENGITEFTKDFILKECIRENLYCGNDSLNSDYVEVGIRSFYRGAENMQDETEKMLCLMNCFNGRLIKEDYTWNEDIFNKLNNFITTEMVPTKKYRLHLDTHLSNAFLAGYLLDSKSGVEVYPMQKTTMGRKFWDVELDSAGNYSDWELNEIILSEEVKDIALVIGVTRDILTDVMEYIKDKDIQISKIISCNVGGHSGDDTIINGTHAKYLANSLSTILDQRNKLEKMNNLHIFASCPVGFIFYLGQRSRIFGKLILYEYDPDHLSDEMYLKSFKLPINKLIIAKT